MKSRCFSDRPRVYTALKRPTAHKRIFGNYLLAQFSVSGNPVSAVIHASRLERSRYAADASREVVERWLLDGLM